MLRQGLISAILLAGLLSCAQVASPVSKCEAVLLGGLKTPASYKRLDDTVGPIENGRQSVFITYDAVNSYNAPIRSVFACDYTPATGGAREADTAADSLDTPAGITQARQQESIAPVQPDPATASAAADPAEDDEVPVCDRPDSPEKSALMNEIGTDCMGE